MDTCDQMWTDVKGRECERIHVERECRGGDGMWMLTKGYE